MQNTYDPLKQYLSSNNQAFSSANLKDLAKSKGFDNYSMSDADNVKLAGLLNVPTTGVSAGTAKTVAAPAVYSGNAALNTKIASLYGKTNTSTSTPTNTPTTGNSAPTGAYTPVQQPQEPNPNANIGDIYGMADYNTANENYLSYATDPTGYLEKQGITQADFKSKALAEMQAQIDSTNALYANKLAESKRLGGNLLGQTGAIQARRGLLGSDFGTAQTEDVNQRNKAIYDNVEQERLAAINDIMSEAETKSATRYAEARAAMEGGLKAKLESIKNKQAQTKTGATEAANSLVAKGFDISRVKPAELSVIAEKYGTTSGAIESAMASLAYASTQEEKKRKQEVEDALAKKGIETITPGQSGYRYNPSTGEYDLVASVPKEGSSQGVTYTADGTPTISQDAANILGLMNLKGGKVDDYVAGTSEAAQKLKNEVNAALLAQGGTTDFAKTANQTAFTSIANTVEELKKNKELAGTFRVRQTDPNAMLSGVLNMTANDYTDFVNKTDLLKGQLLRLDGLALKEIFGPQISNADAASIERIIGQALDPRQQTPVNFEASLNNIINGIQKYNQSYQIPNGVANYENAFNIILNQNTPENRKVIEGRIQELEAQYGRDITEEEYFKAHPYDIPKGFNPVGGDTKPVSAVTIPSTSRLSSVNNNPGNLMFANQPGAVEGEGGFAKFPTPEAGIKALSNQIKLDASRGLSLAKFISKYAPPTENDTALYIANVKKMLGVSENTPISQIDHNALLKAIAKYESNTQIS